LKTATLNVVYTDEELESESCDLRTAFGPKTEDATGGWTHSLKQVHNLQDLLFTEYYSGQTKEDEMIAFVPFALRPVNISVTLCRTIILLNNAFQRI
jgi:hypothetical protein